MRNAIPALLVVALLAATAVYADDDHTRARKALERGEVLPLTAILARVREQYPGNVLETEFEMEDDGYRYELELLDEDGYLLEIELDAATGEILEVEREDD
ncbi:MULTISPECIES: PepSY domain-containing protein [Spiribacter]|jgi:uncharacterized membrane protein YkoI|uniref:Peptidase n=1 Tax=Spiribacter aquaticus TaxID=1935996 RepID=A0A557RK34_9GAMM|nr:MULTISPECIES: PepSY domain-containing protein [Spiribacter]AUB77979.1 hypothetical protein BBH56_01845 [Spiribacter roseus]KAF0279946.1 hypothetical protein BA897_04205 [Spiribacter roseus]KAF0281417.1 hypothetical protein BA900_09550 [Spiribacter roseus]KAF0283599.1 hypothetical protein BA898_03500 [Spiribacter roseus]KAF0286082.1 hypothetical protein BA899_05905 [Spiribacter sp. SSL99]